MKFLKYILIFALGAEAWHLYEHISWQFLSDGQIINVVLTQVHNERSILVNSIIIILLAIAIYFVGKRKEN